MGHVTLPKTNIAPDLLCAKKPCWELCMEGAIWCHFWWQVAELHPRFGFYHIKSPSQMLVCSPLSSLFTNYKRYKENGPQPWSSQDANKGDGRRQEHDEFLYIKMLPQTKSSAKQRGSLALEQKNWLHWPKQPRKETTVRLVKVAIFQIHAIPCHFNLEVGFVRLKLIIHQLLSFSQQVKWGEDRSHQGNKQEHT